MKRRSKIILLMGAIKEIELSKSIEDKTVGLFEN